MCMHRCTRSDARETFAFSCLRQETKTLTKIRDYLEAFKGRTARNFPDRYLRAHAQHAPAYDVSFHPRHTLMATVAADKTVKVYDTRSWDCIASMEHALRSVDFHPVLPLLAVGGLNYASVLAFDNGKFVFEKRYLCCGDGIASGTPHFVRFMPQLQVLIVYTRWRVEFFDDTDFERLGQEFTKDGCIHRLGGPYLCYKTMLCVHPTAPIIVRRYRDLAIVSKVARLACGLVRINDMHHIRVKGMGVPAHVARAHVLCVAVGQAHVAVSFSQPRRPSTASVQHPRIVAQQFVKIMPLNCSKDTTTFKVGIPGPSVTAPIETVPTGRTSGVLDVAVALHPTRPLVAVSSHRFLSLHCANTGKRLRELNLHSACINAVAFHPTLPLLATAASDHRTKVAVVNIGPNAPPSRPPMKKGRWAKPELERLMRAVSLQRGKTPPVVDWKTVAVHVGLRSPQQCCAAYTRRANARP